MVLEAFREFDGQLKKQKLGIAPVFDRVLAGVIDFFLVSPFIGLVCAPLLKQIQKSLIWENGYQELLVFVFILFVTVFFLIFVYQVCTLLIFSATPGQKSLKLLVSSAHGSRLTLGQATIRAFVFNVSVLFFALPFLEVLSHPRRRLLHDRASDTEVLTRKTEGEAPPYWFEVKFIRQVYAVFFLVLIVSVFQVANSLHKAAMKGDFRRAQLEKSNYLCAFEKSDAEKDFEDLDLMITSSLVGSLHRECLLSEADFAFWNAQDKSIPWAYLAKAMYYLPVDKSLAEQYFAKVCEMNKLELCEVSQRFLGKLRFEKNSSNEVTDQFLISKILNFKEAKAFGKSNSAFDLLNELKKYPSLQVFVQQEFVKVLWARGKKQESYGAFLNIIDQNEQPFLSAQMCHQELAQSCQASEVFCQALVNSSEEDIQKSSDPFIATALIKYLSCKGRENELQARMARSSKKNPIRLYYDLLKKDSDFSQVLNQYEQLIASQLVSDEFKLEVFKELSNKIKSKTEQVQLASVAQETLTDTYSKYEILKVLALKEDFKKESKLRMPANVEKSNQEPE
jgi:uncharacterized RDD family membrane protein YckC